MLSILICFLLATSSFAVEKAKVKTKQEPCQCLEPGNPAKKIGIVGSKDAELVAVASLTSSQPSGTVTGTAHFHQRIIAGLGPQLTMIRIHLEGFPQTDDVTEKGWHIHQFGNLTAQPEGKCMSVGTHWNPDNVNHGNPDWTIFHRGDLGNLQVQTDGTSVWNNDYEAVELIGEDSVIGRSLTVHLQRDDLGEGGDAASLANGNSGARVACGVIGWAQKGDVRKAYALLNENQKKKSADFQNALSAITIIQPATPQGTVTGTVQLSQATRGGKVTVKVSLTGLPVSGAPYQVGWHVHEFGDLTAPATGANGICESTGGHYNPKNVSHAGPQAPEKHKGDFGNLPVNKDGTVVYSTNFDFVELNGIYSVIGRAIVIHSNQDDLGLGGNDNSQINGNSGARIACGVIGWATEPGSALLLV